MEHDATRELYKEVCILVAGVSQENPVAHSGRCLESWKSNLEFVQTPYASWLSLPSIGAKMEMPKEQKNFQKHKATAND